MMGLANKLCGARNKLNYSLIALVILTWFLFPIMVARHYIFEVILVTFFAIILIFGGPGYRSRLNANSKVAKIFFAFALYLFSLFFASIGENSDIALHQWLILSSKFIFFIYLTLNLNKCDVQFLLKFYAYLIFYCVLFSIFSCVVVYSFDVNQLKQLSGLLTNRLDLGSEIIPNSSFFRVRGFAEEPGTFAFSIFPAIFYFLLVETRKLQVLICALGLVLTLSFGAAIFCVFLSFFFLFKIGRNFHRLALFFLILFSTLMLIYMESSISYADFYQAKSHTYLAEKLLLKNFSDKLSSERDKDQLRRMIERSSSTTLSGKNTSFQDRVNGVSTAINFLKIHPWGAGASMGMAAVGNSISVGFVIAIVDSGIIGGVCYILFFSLITLEALYIILSKDMATKKDSVKFVLGLSTISLIFMGLQRMQPDMSLWHFWIYASMIVPLGRRGHKVMQTR